MPTILREPIWFGPVHLGVAGTPAFTGYPVNNTTTAVYESMLEALEDATITQVMIRQNSRTGTPGIGRVGLEGINATGGASGAFLGAGGLGYVDYTPIAGNDNKGVWLTLTGSVDIVRAQRLAITARGLSGTWDASNLWTLGSRLSQITGPLGFPYIREGGTKAGAIGIAAIASTTKVYGMPIENSNVLNVSTITSPDEIGLEFTVGSEYGDAFSVGAAYIAIGPTAGHTFDLILYQGTTPLQTITGIDTDQASNTGVRCQRVGFAGTLAGLTPGVTYILAWRPGTSTNQTIGYVDVNRVMDLTAWQGDCPGRWVQRVDGGAWTANPLRVPMIAPEIESISGTSVAPYPVNLTRSPFGRGGAR